jgi:hypothetical protein
VALHRHGDNYRFLVDNGTILMFSTLISAITLTPTQPSTGAAFDSVHPRGGLEEAGSPFNRKFDGNRRSMVEGI